MPSITSELIIKLKDQVSGPAKNAATALGTVQKAEAALQQQAEKLSKSTKALSEFKGLDKSLQETTRKFEQQQRAVKDLGQQILATDGPTKKLEASFKKADAILQQTAKSMEKQKKALVDIGRSFEQIGGSKIGSIVNAEQHLRREIDATTTAMRKQAKESHRFHRSRERVREFGRRVADTGAGIFLEYEAMEGARRVVERYRDFDKERRYGKVVMGLTDAQQAPLVAQAIHGGGTTKFNDIQWLETQRELAARGYQLQQVQAFAPVTAQIGQAFDVTMPEAVKALEGAMLGFKKDVSTFDKAVASANTTADLEVKASKISGMNFEDIVQLYKYAAAPAQMAHLSEANMLAFGAISKKANMGGDESGVAFRALGKNLLTPTAEARVAMQAAGIDFSKSQTTPKAMDLHGFVSQVAKTYGIRLNEGARAGLDKVFKDPSVMGDADEFMPAVVDVLKGALGKQDAKSLKSIAGLAGRYRDASMAGVDTNGLMSAIMGAISKNPALSNSIFGSKQGGRIFAALGDPGFYAHIMDELENHSKGFAEKVSDERMKGFDGAVSRFEGAIANLETAVGRSLDNNGNGGLLTGATNLLGEFTQHLAEANPHLLQTGAATAALGSAIVALNGFDLLKSGFGMSGAATQLEMSAVALQEAAVSLGAKGGAGIAAAEGGAAAVGGKSFLSRALRTAGAATGLATLAQLAQEYHVLADQKRSGWGGVLEGLDPGLANWLLGPATSASTHRPPTGAWHSQTPLTPSDAGDRMKERNDLIESESQKLRDSVWQFGQLDDSALRLKASFEALSGSVGSGGGGGLINASYGGGDIGGGGGGGSSGGKLAGVHPVLQAMVTRAAEIAGVPLSVYSGYRSPGHNAAVGGAGHSLHMNGWAADLSSPGHAKSDTPFWSRINEAMAKAAKEMNQPYRWGGHFPGRFRHDNDHFDLTPRGPVANPMPVRARRKSNAIEARGGGVYSPTIHIHVAGGANLDHQALGDRIASTLHRHYEDSLRASYADTGFG